MRPRVLLVAAELDLRARFARELHSSGYAVELACDMKRALRLAADRPFSGGNRGARTKPRQLGDDAGRYATPCRK